MSLTKLNTSDKLMSAAALLNPNLSVKLVSACAVTLRKNQQIFAPPFDFSSFSSLFFFQPVRV